MILHDEVRRQAVIFFGSKGKIVTGEVLQGFPCPECGGSQFATFGILNYFHIYWIPTFLKSKKAGMECMHCKKTLIDDEVPPHLIDQIKSSTFRSDIAKRWNTP